MSTRKAEDKVKEYLASRPLDWIGSPEIAQHIMASDPTIPLPYVYLAVSNLSRKEPFILRRPATKGFEYAHNPNPPIKKRKPYTKSDQAEPKSPPQRKAHSVHWTEAERLTLAREALRIRAETPHLPTSNLIIKMQDALSKDRRRTYLRKMADVAWLESYMKLVASVKDGTASGYQRSAIDEIAPELFKAAPMTVKPEEATAGPPKPKYDIFEHIREREAVAAQERSESSYTSEVLKSVEELSTDPAKNQASLESFGLDAILGEALKRLGAPLKALLLNVLTDPALKEALTIKTDVHVHHHHHHHYPEGKEPASADERPAEPAVTTSETTHEYVERRAEPRSPKPKIGVVGDRNVFEADLVKAFPHLKFVVTSKKYHEATDAVKNCDKVIVMTKFLNHPTVNNVKAAVGDRFVPLHGGVSDIKRQINLWINAGILPKD